MTKTYIKNAFSNKEYNLTGSPASVNLVDDINDFEFMLSITKELKLPISVFLKETAIKNKFQVRYFIDEGEEPICGHGTLVATQFLLDNKLTDGDTIEFEPMFLNDKYGKSSKQNSIYSQINGNNISIFIKVVEPKTVSKSKMNEISASLLKVNNKNFIIKDVVEGEFDYTIEIEKSDFAKTNNISSLEVIKSIVPDFDLIEKIALSTGKLCRGLDVLIKNDGDTAIDCDYITRIFLPLGALEEFKEDPACGSGTSYVMKYLIGKHDDCSGKEIKFYQASKDGAYIKAIGKEENLIKVSGRVE